MGRSSGFFDAYQRLASRPRIPPLRVWGISIGCTLALTIWFHGKTPTEGAAASRHTVSVSIDLSHPGRSVPRDFLGLSFEVASVHQIARYGAEGDFVRMLRSLGKGLIRFGGVTADTQVAWAERSTPAPEWASSSIQAEDLQGLRRLASRSGWRIVLTIGLAHFDPGAAASEAAAAKRALGPWLAGIEIGNEPDSYGRHGVRSQPWTVARYDADVSAYRDAIEQAAPGLAVLGPDVSGSLIFERWGPWFASAQRPAFLTGHHYPLGCNQTPKPSIARLLSVPIRRAEGQSLKRYMSVSRTARTPFRMDETGSVSCGGTPGISNTFASSLWAFDYVLHTMAAGAAGINFEGNPGNCEGYTPVCGYSARALAEGALTAQPEWYALLASRSLLGDRPVRTVVSTGAANVDVLSFLGSDRTLQVAIVDDEPPSAPRDAIELHLPAGYLSASLLALSAPSPRATSGVRLGGRAVTGDGSWQPVLQRPVPLGARRLTLEVPHSSVMLVTLHARASRSPRGM